jgi:predicted transposase YbfD/YdcC
LTAKVRGSHHGERGQIHLVSAWSTTAGVTLGQIRTADKSNEITAIPELLEALDIDGAVITIDAMGCQHDIATRIVQGGADYVLAVKDNQPGLAEAIRLWFDSADAGSLDRPFWDDTRIDKDHGRIETRRCVATNDVDWLPEQGQRWAGLQSLAMVESARDILHDDGTRVCRTERRY